MADTWQWNDFIEVLSGDELRHYAQEHNVFIYPYDIFTSSDIAMFKNVKVKDPKNRFIVCALNDMNEKDTKEGKVIYEIEPWARMCEWESCAVAPPAIEAAESGEDTSSKIYCQEIRNSMGGQISEIGDLRTRISDRAVKRYVEDILKALQEIQQAISVTESSAKVLSARRIVSYWNDELISLLKSYMDLLNNSSQEAVETKDKIEDILQDLYPVYQKELGRITKAETLEIDAAIDIMRKEIDQVMDKGR